ncbi:MAG: HAD family hydrolase [Candidatus Moranbacteria bacterium]|nr:HAD family hydrolase [Candidatus Moranbacteria bacterium]
MLKAIIFDFDGVIVDSLELWTEAFISACKGNGFSRIASKEAFLNLFDGNFYEEMLKAGIAEKEVPLMRKKLEHAYAENKDSIKLIDGMRETLDILAKENQIYIVSSNFSGIVQDILDSRGIEISGEILGADKGKSKVKKIESIKSRYFDHIFFYIGDTRGDMIEGKIAGVKTVAVTWGWHSREKLNEGKPDYLVNTPQELVKLINSL